jgi:hypothetical protein
LDSSIAVQVVREADGYQAHLVSPEFGLRRLVDETIGMVLDPVNLCVRRVHQILIDAARSVFIGEDAVQKSVVC